ncbi:BON domain-containing protein [Aeoliella mucimassa]|uniref:BON domain protein n=1 Tax=Aeoliella mucimassa TaxID=2527972 RepID=A0A518ANL3_9BACT|nr:BON domain-containing protein [Aeoliella mucimassa]QDU56314.1 BON domain protein [Aeoliella mucimassa]
MLETVHEVPQLIARISAALESSPYISPGKVRVESGEEGEVRLHGRVQTFFEKQMAQESIRHLAGESRIHNMVEVTW